MMELYKTKIYRKPNTEEYEYELNLPKELKEWNVWDNWEKRRFEHMKKHLTNQDILFEIGAEYGIQTAMYAKYIMGGENIVLFEPGPKFWNTIKTIWDGNDLETPKDCVLALVGQTTKDSDTDTGQAKKDGWVEAINQDVGFPGRPYRYLHNEKNVAETPQISIDDYVKSTSIVPTALSIDVEGAELEVIKGAKETLRNNDVKVWISIHPSLLSRDYHIAVDNVIDYLSDLGYKPEYISRDHEEHWLFRKD